MVRPVRQSAYEASWRCFISKAQPSKSRPGSGCGQYSDVRQIHLHRFSEQLDGFKHQRREAIDTHSEQDPQNSGLQKIEKNLLNANIFRKTPLLLMKKEYWVAIYCSSQKIFIFITIQPIIQTSSICQNTFLWI